MAARLCVVGIIMQSEGDTALLMLLGYCLLDFTRAVNTGLALLSSSSYLVFFPLKCGGALLAMCFSLTEGFCII